MTLWNPLFMFSASQRPAGSAASSSFDPSRTGDQLGPIWDRPGIGFGDTSVGSPVRHSDAPRRPIGFGPPREEQSPEPVYRTEISFKRHHEDPRMGAVPDPPEPAPQDPWETTQPVAAEEIEVDSIGEIVEEPAATEERVPFFKREISFRRKRTPAQEPPEVADEQVDATDAVAEAQAEEPRVVEESLAVEVPVADMTPEEPEIQLEPDAVLAEEPFEVEPVEAEPVAVADELTEPEPDFEPTSVHDLEPVPAEPDIPTDPFAGRDDDLFIEDTPAPGRRRRNGEEKRSEKAPKRKTSRGKGRRVVGLKIGASQIAAAVVEETEGGHELVALARRPLAGGIVVDGEVRDHDALTHALKTFFEEEGLPKKDIRIGLASNRIGVRTFDIVGIEDEARFDNAVRFKAHELLPVAAHESVLDYRVLEERPNEAGELSRRVMLVVAPRDQVEPYSEVARRAGLKLAGIDLEALGLLRAFVEPKPFAVRTVDDTATVVVGIGHEWSTLLVAGGGSCEFTRVFDWGGGALQEAIAKELDVQQAEAATILRHLSLTGPGRQFAGLDDETRTRALDAVRQRLTPFARELVSSLQFYQTQSESLGIGGILITGGTSQLEGLGETLHQMIGVDVAVGDPLSRVSTSADFDPAVEQTIGSMAVPIGLAIDDIAMRGVNLLPKDDVKERSTRTTLVAIGAPFAAVAPLVAVGVLYLGAHGTVSDRQTELDAVEAEIASLPKPAGPDIDASIVGDEATRATAVASVLGGRVAWDAVFSDLARVLPANVWLEGLSVQQPEAAVLADGTTVAATPTGQAPAAPTGVSLTGFTYSQPDVARLLARLATLPSLQRVTLTSSGTEEIGAKTVIRFVIVADLNQTGGAS